MLKEILSELFDRDFVRLRSEIEQFANDADLWKTSDGVTNSAGNLCKHLNGNLQHFFGAVIGDSDYIRDRDAEFALRSGTKAELLRGIDAAEASVRATLAAMTDEELLKNYPIEVFDHPMTTGFFLTHLSTHFNYHLGQINYQRRLLAAKA